MFSFTIAEFTFLCAGFAFVGSLILFPSFRQQLKALAGGFLQVFVQDTAKTPDGARAIYAQKIDEMTEKYTDACNTLRDLTGKLKTIQDNYAVCQKQAKGYDERAKAARVAVMKSPQPLTLVFYRKSSIKPRTYLLSSKK